MKDLHPNLRLWIYSGRREGVFGDGKARLLTEIARTGSLRQAAAALGISYRKAWGDLKKAESCLNRPLFARVRGGKGGGRTLLTPEGQAVLAAYETFRTRMHAHVEREFAQFADEVFR